MLKLETKKDASLVSWAIARPRLPKKVWISLKGMARPIVEPETEVLVGTKIAEPIQPDGLAVHASVSGKVSSIASFPDPNMGLTQAICIETEDDQRFVPDYGKERAGWDKLSQEELLRIFQGSGLSDLNAQALPLHVKLTQKRDKPVQTLIINGCESEPYVTCDHSLMMSHPVEILKGAEILRYFLNAENVVLATEDNKLEVAELLKSKIYFHKWKHFDVRIFKSLYPQAHDAVLTRHILGPRDQSGLILNVATAFAVYEAVVLQKPFVERAVTIGGECVAESKNIWAKVGTTFQDALKSCKGLLREPRKLIMGGAMKGLCLPDTEVSVTSATQAILALPKEVAKPESVSPCIRCSRCVEACPENLSPVMITLAAEREFFDFARQEKIDQCIECGNCSYVCPAKRPMMQLIQYAKQN